MKTAKELIEEHVTSPFAAPDEWMQGEWEEFRCTGEATGLDHKHFSRHYECDIHAAQIGDVWVAWPYWHGGGKHGCPEEIPWLDDAFYVDAKQETRVVNVFSRKPAAREDD